MLNNFEIRQGVYMKRYTLTERVRQKIQLNVYLGGTLCTFVLLK